MPGEAADESLHDGGGAGGRSAPFPGGRANHRPASGWGRAGSEVGAAQAGGGGAAERERRHGVVVGDSGSVVSGGHLPTQSRPDLGARRNRPIAGPQSEATHGSPPAASGLHVPAESCPGTGPAG